MKLNRSSFYNVTSCETHIKCICVHMYLCAYINIYLYVSLWWPDNNSAKHNFHIFNVKYVKLIRSYYIG